MALTRPSLSSTAIIAKAVVGPIPDTEIKLRKISFHFPYENQIKDVHHRE